MNSDTNIRDKILERFPEVTFTGEPDEPAVTVAPPSLRALAILLKEDGELRFDYLRHLTGTDWGEGGLGVVYHLESTAYGHQLIVRTMTADRENPELASVCDIWKTAELNEREVYDYYGIHFTNHPDMRRLFLREDWVGYPLRKDYDADRETNPVRMTNEIAVDSTSTFVLDEKGRHTEKMHVLFEDEEYVINIGPQHPATHGVLRFRVSLEGEFIRKLDVHCGYIHRGIEKLCESLTYPQILAFTDRLDYLSAMQNRHAFCLCVEKGLAVEVPERVKYIRTIMDELQRIDSHLLFFSTLCMDLGALTAFFYGFRDREMILDIFEETTG
ncbi:MAG: NADH-quinone oxidoreductase subunit C, partial [Tannerella sp.]|nr:NADH-quinone oxidoreductase subunit C [Tannerella sp.]